VYTHDSRSNPADREDLIARARDRATGPERDGEWGDRIDTLEDTGDEFVGRFRGEAEDESYEGHGRRIHLFWSDQDETVWFRGKWALNREIDQRNPNVGDLIAIVVGDRWEGKDGLSGFYYGVEVEQCDDPLPGSSAPIEPEPVTPAQASDEVPF
jgi:hypothetical protein